MPEVRERRKKNASGETGVKFGVEGSPRLVSFPAAPRVSFRKQISVLLWGTESREKRLTEGLLSQCGRSVTQRELEEFLLLLSYHQLLTMVWGLDLRGRKGRGRLGGIPGQRECWVVWTYPCQFSRQRRKPGFRSGRRRSAGGSASGGRRL